MASKQHKGGPRKKLPTPGQCRARTEMCTLSVAWNELTDEQRQAWDTVKSNHSCKNGLG